MVMKAKYKNPVEFIQFDGTNQEAIKEFTGSSYVDTIKYMGKDDLVAIQFNLDKQRVQINKGYYVVNIHGSIGTFSPDIFEEMFEVID